MLFRQGHLECEGVDLHALGRSGLSESESGASSSRASDEPSVHAGWGPDWARLALDELFGPLAETAAMLQMSTSTGQADEADKNIGAD